MTGAGDIALSGLQAQMKRLSVSAGNVAGAQTPGFTAKDTVLETRTAGGVAARTVDTGLEVDLTREAVIQMQTEIAFKASVDVIGTEKEMLGDLLDIMA